MKLYFLRHGIAADREEWTGSDYDRPLTGEGCERMEREARALAALGIAPDLILTSPLVRAKQTAQLLAKGIKYDNRLTEDERLGPGFNVQRLRAILRQHPSAGSIVLVGHEPDMSETIGSLVGGGRIAMKKGGLAFVEVSDASAASGELVWLIPPKVLTQH
jgi:phosphohistidine phosphatase